MGPNGAGKSLLLRLLHGLIVPQSGSVLWDGAPLDSATRARQAMVFQKPVLLRRSVAANVDFVLRARGRRDRAARDALLARVGLSDHAAQPARLLSGGEQQRLALARALAVQPEVLFLDEPTASLDPASALMIEEIARNIRDQGTKLVFITHDIGQARRLADDVVFVARGQAAEHTPARQFFDQPTSEAARAYLAGRLVL
ncbi:ATP-binding cassette domain-containing protein [Puniceibacterium sp. IMCC21224]|uniref:ATP-binding cassette domain-containing protein n=1 Tax=Puniceibacterium sp. IMCC21224 TaxID=1618204 RepID=UPI0035102B6E